MTLYRQLIVIVIALFIAGFIGSFSISSANLRHFLDKQLASHAQDTATSLGLSLSTAVHSDDQPVLEAMIDAVFDRGYYQRIEVTAVNGETLVERSNPVRIKDVPDWFVRHVGLDTPGAEALVMAGWKQAATVHVSSHPGHAYQELWQNTVDTFWMFFLTALAVMLLGLIMIRVMLRPLQGVESQAEAVCNGSYPIQEKLPRTRELRRVVEAMNRLSRKVNESFAKHSALTDRLRNEAYRDPLTGLGNRRWFDQQLQHHLDTQETPARGALILVALQRLDRVNINSGYQAGDHLLQTVAELIESRIRHYPNCYVSRLSGTEFGLIGVDLGAGEAETLAGELARDLAQPGVADMTPEASVAHIGVAMWEHGDAAGKLLAEVDIAMRTAQASGDNAWHRYKPATESATPVRGNMEWHDYLRQVIHTGGITLFTQSVYALSDGPPRPIHRELLARLTDDNGKPVDAGLFMPIARRLGLAIEIDRTIVSLAIQHLETHRNDDMPVAVNLTARSAHDPAFLGWLHETLSDNPGTAKRLMFELPESAIATDTRNVAAAIERLAAAGYSCGIDHFGRSFQSLAHLRSLKVQYLKIDGAFTRDIHRDSDKQFFLRALCDTAHSIDIQVIAGAVETGDDAGMIARLNVDGVQGHLYGKPVPA
jgi:diguanylate cyclase (GGDEF)-like protein